MQQKMRKAIITGALGAAVFLSVLIVGLNSASSIVLLTTWAIGLIVIGAATSIGLRVISNASEVIKRLASRVGCIEAYTLEHGKACTELKGSVTSLDSDYQITNAEIRGIRGQLKVLRNRVPAGYMRPVQKDVYELKEGISELMQISFESSLQLNRDPRDVISSDDAIKLFQKYIDQGELLKLRPLIEDFDLLKKQRLSTLRLLFRFYRSAGYWDLASLVIKEIREKSALESDAHAAEKLQHEVRVFSQPGCIAAELKDGAAYDPAGPILHMVGRVLPQTQTGYTLRTQYTALAQARAGLPVAIVGQSGITDHVTDAAGHYTFQDIDYYLLPGPVRNEVLLDDWLRHNIEQFAALVRRIRPSILHVQSDFFNSLIVSAVGKKYGIPTVYESRGFWEDSWLSRTIAANQWHNPENLFAMYGQPNAYRYRKQAEETARLLPDHVFTLAEVMRDHILESAQGALTEDTVTLVPNAVESSNFPVQDRDLQLAKEIGLPQDAITVGYISSIVEYEGIDTLIKAFHRASLETTKTMCLLLVGDGDYLPTLESLVEELGTDNVFFTGRVPHENILSYYGLIDVFVVPRKSSTVADLVTPLKPFEAFSTGRAVILSDVAALREIANQSAAVELFRAGDADDLARKILSLVHDPQRVQELSHRASRWVRNHRSWDNNVNEYYRIYRKLGYAGPRNLAIESQLALSEYGVNPGELMEAMEFAKLPPSHGWFTIQESTQSGCSLLRDGWKFEDFHPIDVSSLHDWAHYGNADRSWGFHLHAWEFMDPLLREYDETGDVRWLDQAVRIGLRWVSQHRGEPDTHDDAMAWYDMSLALRTPRLIALAVRAARHEHTSEEAMVLGSAIVLHLDELSKDSAYNPNNNHGFFTAVAQLHAAKYAPMFPNTANAKRMGRERVQQMGAAQFSPDGTHLEHSPDYHRMLLYSFEMAVADDLVNNQEIKKRVKRAAHAIGWMVQPDGTLVQFGDTPEIEVVSAGSDSTDPQTTYILSNGAYGEEPNKELAVYPDGGYAFVRSPQPTGLETLQESGYLAFSAAFHSRAHKHADDLNVVWYDRGQEILVDAGRFGYGELLPDDSPLRREGFYYAAPERQYVESTMAHNTLMMDGRDQDRRSRKPYGSGIGQCTQENGVFDLTGRVQHLDYTHRRRVVYRPGIELLLIDSLYSQVPEKREATIWLNVAGRFELDSIDDGVIFSSDTAVGNLRLRIDGPGDILMPVKGQKSPLRGWRSRNDRLMEPTWSVGFSFGVSTRDTVETRLQILN